MFIYIYIYIYIYILCTFSYLSLLFDFFFSFFFYALTSMATSIVRCTSLSVVSISRCACCLLLAAYDFQTLFFIEKNLFLFYYHLSFPFLLPPL